METILTTHSAEETKQLAAKLLENKTNIVTLKGELGAGKTTLVQGLGEVLKINRMTSPTFTIIKSYPLESNPYGFHFLYHIDLYRLTNINEVLELGIEELWADRQNLLIIEWPEVIESLLPEHLETKIKITGPDQRQITITPHS